MAEKLTTYDPAEDLTFDEAIATFMAEAFESEDAGFIAHALGAVARAKGMAQTWQFHRRQPWLSFGRTVLAEMLTCRLREIASD